MSRFGRWMSSMVLGVLVACTSAASGGSAPDVTGAQSPSPSAEAGVVTPFEGEWQAVVTEQGMRSAGFSSSQIDSDQRHEGWSSTYDLGLTVTGDLWVLTEAPDGAAPVVGAHGPIAVDGNRVRMTDISPPSPSCTTVLDYDISGDDLTMSFVRSDCDQNPIERIPDFMYAAVFVMPYRRVS